MPAATRHEAELAMNKRDRGTSDSLFTGGAGSRKRPHSDLSSARMPAMLHDGTFHYDDGRPFFALHSLLYRTLITSTCALLSKQTATMTMTTTTTKSGAV